MTLTMTIRLALRALRRNKLRSFLTTLGIIIGVFAVISMVAVGEGAKSRVEESFNSMGSNLLVLVPGTSSRGGVLSGFGTMPTITWEDLKAIRAEAPAVQEAAAYQRVVSQVQSQEQNWTTSVAGTSPEFFRMHAWPVATGRQLSQSDIDGGAKVAVLGRTVADRLFGSDSNPNGQIVRIKNVPFEVIGVLEKKGQSVTGQDHDDAVYVPQSTFQSKVQGGLQKYIQGMVFVQATAADTISKAQSQVSTILRDRHRIQPGGTDDFSFRNLSELALLCQDCPGFYRYASLMEEAYEETRTNPKRGVHADLPELAASLKRPLSELLTTAATLERLRNEGIHQLCDTYGQGEGRQHSRTAFPPRRVPYYRTRNRRLRGKQTREWTT
jgi:putative ABC transport system permease protein